MNIKVLSFLSRMVLVFTILISLSAAQQTPPPVYPSGIIINTLKSWEVKRPFINEADIPASTRSLQEVTQTAVFEDGFGRPLQTVVRQASPASNDLVFAQTYDSYGREQFRYLQFASNVAQTGDVTNDGNIKVDPFQEQVAFYNSQLAGQQNETNQGTGNLNWAYSKKNFEASPLNRITATYEPGTNWVGSEGGSTPHNIRQQFLVNTATDNVRIWNISSTQGSLPTSTGMYSAGTLNKTISSDEQNNQTIEFKDQYGQTILKKVQLSAASDNGSGSGHLGWLCTYYVYDDYGNTRFIITPNVVTLIDGTWVISQSNADELCYRIEYDQINRPVIKKSPGAAEVWMIYDQWNRMVLKQDGNLRGNNQWLYVKYDGLDRSIMTGIYVNTTNTTQASMQAFLTSSGLGRSETFQVATYPLYSLTLSFPSVALSTVLNFTYYDGYSWGSWYGAYSSKDNTYDGNFQGANNSTYPYPQPLTQSGFTRGMKTGYWDGSSVHANFYDNMGRVIQSKDYNITTGVDITTTQYNFAGKPLQTYLRQQIGGTSNPQTHTVSTKMDYDPMLRTLHIYKNVDGASTDQVISTLQYNELGQLQKKTFGSNIESLSYDYNVRGWLLGGNRAYISNSASNYFGFELGYDKSNTVAAGTTFVTPAFNGNIGGSVWKSLGDGINRKFDYNYDNTKELTSAPYLQNSTTGTWDKSYIDFSVNSLSYDGNGNIGSMSENGFLLGSASANIDNLSYSYINGNGNSNRLQNVTDASNNPLSTLADFHYPSSKPTGNIDYTYDNNGNIISDYNRAISSITYNYLNLPLLINITSKGTIQYIYDALGNKIRKIVADNTTSGKTVTITTDYIGSFEYKSKKTTPTADPSDYSLVLQFVSHEEGRVRYFPVAGTIPAHFAYDYFIKDYLGNVRMVLTDEQQQDIYPAATLENLTYNGGTALSVESNYYSINTPDLVQTSTLPWFTGITGSNYQNQNNNGVPINNDQYSNVTASSTQAYRLNGQTGDKYGLGITLKVMAGDKISILGRSFWHNTGLSLSSYPITGVLSAFLGAFAGTQTVISGGHGIATGAVLDGSTAITTPLTSILNGTPNQPNPATQPKAAINWILFDDQFRPVSVGTDLVDPTGASVKAHSILNIPMAKDGYLYVYCSNENNIDVYFDNLQVVDTRGPILEETHYYPVGLAMAAICDHAWNKMQNYYHYQSNELQTQEFGDGSTLEECDFKAREYDQQLGLWHEQDPQLQFSSPYLAMANCWPNGTDKDGKSWIGNFLKLAVGMFAWNDHRTIGGNLWAIISRSIFESPQEVTGTGLAGLINLFGGVTNVEFFDGATVVHDKWLQSGAAFTLGNTINGGSLLQASATNGIFQHEYGRVLQSQAQGISYLAVTGLPSLFDNGSDPNGDRYARDGNARALNYFSKFYGGADFVFKYWDFSPGYFGGNPISGYDITKSVYDPDNQAAIKENERYPGLVTFFGQ